MSSFIPVKGPHEDRLRQLRDEVLDRGREGPRQGLQDPLQEVQPHHRRARRRRRQRRGSARRGPGSDARLSRRRGPDHRGARGTPASGDVRRPAAMRSGTSSSIASRSVRSRPPRCGRSSRAGEIDVETYAWREGFGDWLRLGSIEDFRDLGGGGARRATKAPRGAPTPPICSPASGWQRRCGRPISGRAICSAAAAAPAFSVGAGTAAGGRVRRRRRRWRCSARPSASAGAASDAQLVARLRGDRWRRRRSRGGGRCAADDRSAQRELGPLLAQQPAGAGDGRWSAGKSSAWRPRRARIRQLADRRLGPHRHSRHGGLDAGRVAVLAGHRRARATICRASARRRSSRRWRRRF